MAQPQSLETLRAIEEGITRHRAFGDSTYILNQLQLCLKRRLNKISPRLPLAGQLLDELSRASPDSLHHLVGDTVVRCAIIHAHTQIETEAAYGLPLAECEEVFAATIDRLKQGKFGTPVDDGSLPRLGPQPYHGWIWSDEHSNDIFGRSFRYLMKERYDALPSTPDRDEIALLAKGSELLAELLPALTPSALSHAHVIAFVPNAGGWKGTASSSQFLLGGTIFLGRTLRNPWWVAEHLLHESSHQKLYDFRQGHSLLQLDFAKDDGGPRVVSPWNPQQLGKANQWDVHRVFAAFHVYVHLALLALIAEQRAEELEDEYGPLHAMIESSKALERAHYLGEKLKEQCWNHLGLAGQRMADWLLAALEFMNPAPPPKGAYVHLCVDLYEREANQVAGALRESESAMSSLAPKLVPLARDEVERTRRVLSDIGAGQELQQFNGAVEQYADEELGTKFPELRRLIGTTLMSASATRYRLTESGDRDELLRQMIESASQRVYAVLAGYPPAVAEAKRRASELRFASSCSDDVGRLLAVLACAVPPSGRILEIGTGAGVGTAWIIAGLAARTDVEVVSVEIDTRLSDAARAWPWPAYLRIVNADAAEAVGALDTFNLVFADAAPVKYGSIDTVLRTLRPGGVLVLDDLRADLHTSQQQRAEKNALRQILLHHPELHAVEMEWSTGLLLATKSMPVVARPAASATPRPRTFRRGVRSRQERLS